MTVLDAQVKSDDDTELSRPAPQTHRGGPGVALIITALFSLIAGALAIVSDGGYMDDDVTHFLIARSAWLRPSLLLDQWGRPGFTIPHALVAWLSPVHLGFIASRLLSVATTALAGWLTYRSASLLGVRWPWLAVVALWLMPLNFHLSFTSTTETAAALYAIAGTYLLLRRRWKLAAVVLAILPATRHELAPFLIPVFALMLLRRQWLAAILLGWVEATWNAAVWALSLQPPGGRLPIERFFSTSDPGPLGFGHPAHFLNRWLDMSGIVIAGLVVSGMVLAALQWYQRCRSPLLPDESTPNWQLSARLLVSLLGIGLGAMHAMLYVFNSFQSGGYARFLVPAAPLMAITATFGLSHLVDVVRPVGAGATFKRAAMLPTATRLAMLPIAAMAAVSLCGGIVPFVGEPTRWALLILALTAAITARKAALIATLAIALFITTVEWAGLARPHRLTAEQQLIRSTLDELRVSHPDHRVAGSSPWIEYFLDRDVNLPRAHDPYPWSDSHPVQSLYLYDQTHGKPDVLAAMQTLRHRLLFVRDIPGRPNRTPYVQIFERLP